MPDVASLIRATPAADARDQVCAHDRHWRAGIATGGVEREARVARQSQEALKLHRAGQSGAEIAALMETT
jgi:hypothetical protein